MLIKDFVLHVDGFHDMKCQVPCSFFGELRGSGQIPDPFYGTNESEITPLALKDCLFEGIFHVSPEYLSKDYVELVFNGLDTLCDIELNGYTIASVSDMHVTYIYEVKDKIKEGDNVLKLYFKSPMKYFEKWDKKHYLYCNDGDTIPGTSHLRKAYYQSGWDWAPTFPDMGIFRDIELKSYNVDTIEATIISQSHSANCCDVTLTVSTRHHSPVDIYATLDGQRHLLQNGKTVFHIENPRLWWVRGYGEQYLYDLDIQLCVNGEITESLHRKIGLRTLTVSTARDEDGREFAFVINGIKIFAMGANYIPQDSFLPSISRERTKKLIDAALFANFNCLRVWGGGYYPEDYFYELCDLAGILVWQDFMVACANIYLTSDMRAHFKEEAICNLSRINHHPSLAILCGNNEMEEGVLIWGSKDNRLVINDYIELYEHILPELTDVYAPDTFYWPSSPSSGGGFDEPGNHSKGDTHYWEVWHGGVPFTTYRKKHFRFCSEYGFESFPSMKTINTFCPAEEQNCFSRIMENHQKCKGGNGKILRYLADNYLYPGSFENLVYASQLLQADAIRYGVEHFRRERGFCMGSIYWQFNDCWPVASWSSMDYYGRYKALHYAARKFYAPVAMGLFLEDNSLTINVSCEHAEDFHGFVACRLMDRDFHVLKEWKEECFVGSASSSDVFECTIPQCNPYEDYLYADLYDEDGSFIMRHTEIFVPPKHFSFRKPELSVNFSQCEDGVLLKISSDTFAKGIYLDFAEDYILSDNFFDLADSHEYSVIIATDRSPSRLRQSLTLKTVYDIR